MRSLILGIILAAPSGFFAYLAHLENQSNATLLLFSTLAVLTLLCCLLLRSTGAVIATTVALFVALQPVATPYLVPPIKRLPVHVDLSMDPGLPKLDSQVRVTTDAEGFRVTADRDVAAYEAGELIILVGGSTTEQIMLDDQKTSGYILSTTLDLTRPYAKVINTGVSGLRAKQHKEHLDYFNKTYPNHPKIFLILLGVNDWNRAAIRLRDGLPLDGIDDASSLIPLWQRPSSFAVVEILRGLIQKYTAEPATLFSPDDTDRALMGKYPGKPKHSLDHAAHHAAQRWYAQELRTLIQRCNQSRARCLFATQPHGYTPQNFADPGFVFGMWMTPPYVDWALDQASLIALANGFNDRLKSVVAASDCNSCSVIDAAAIFAGQPELFYDDLHFTNQGAALLASIYAAALTN